MIATSQAIGLARVNVQRIDLAHEISCQFLFVCSFFPQVTNREISWLEIYLPKKKQNKRLGIIFKVCRADRAEQWLSLLWTWLLFFFLSCIHRNYFLFWFLILKQWKWIKVMLTFWYLKWFGDFIILSNHPATVTRVCPRPRIYLVKYNVNLSNVSGESWHTGYR